MGGKKNECVPRLSCVYLGFSSALVAAGDLALLAPLLFVALALVQHLLAPLLAQHVLAGPGRALALPRASLATGVKGARAADIRRALGESAGSRALQSPTGASDCS